MATENISHDEVWDDSALVSSWNEALAEYKKYHSLAARGEKIPIVNEQTKAMNVKDAQDKAVTQEEQDDEQPYSPRIDIHDESTTRAQPTQESSRGPKAPIIHPQSAFGAATLPTALLNGVQDEGLKNIMLSWYYAGYYTGLYEGQQKAYANMQAE